MDEKRTPDTNPRREEEASTPGGSTGQTPQGTGQSTPGDGTYQPGQGGVGGGGYQPGQSERAGGTTSRPDQEKYPTSEGQDETGHGTDAS
jgi:hypothetical protein